MTSMPSDTQPFHDLDAYVALARQAGLVLSPDGTRLITTVSELNEEKTGYTTSLWEVDPTGEREAHQLTRSEAGEAAPVFDNSCNLYFTSKRPLPASEEEASGASLWRLPRQGGEAEFVRSHPGGISKVIPARQADQLYLVAPKMAGATSAAEHAELSKTRKTSGVDAILHTGYPVRFWDHDLGPSHPAIWTPAEDGSLKLLSADLGAELEETHQEVSPDGTFALTTVARPMARAERRDTVVRIDLATGAHHVVADAEGVEFGVGPISPDGTRAVLTRTSQSTTESAPNTVLAILNLSTDEITALAEDWDRWPAPMAWTGDGRELIVVADDLGRGPVFAIDVVTDAVRQVTTEDAAYSTVVVAPDGQTLYGVRSSYRFPAEVVRINLSSGEATPLKNPVARPVLPGRLEEVETTAEDGTPVRAWLALPDSSGPTSPAPMLLWVHGGPLSSWNAWTWRWNPWLMVAQGYAVLLPDPALSTGYGYDFIQRGWGAWGGASYTDLMSITDTVEQRPDIDASRTAAMGGSYGGYMANWIAGHTDRFNAIVTHASLWELEGFGPTTDAGFYWQREMSAEMAARNSPHRFVEDIVSPVLVIHGDRDYRVPIGEGLRLWYELLSKSGRPADENGETDHQFLYFPQENHWIQAPQHAKIWYQVVSNFLQAHVLSDADVTPPVELGRSAPAVTDQSDI
ncbi:prolyl oligopeptidase family serine peptidase [Ornithinimicrobium sp. Arc0846-15]|nr:prolyl oligopeptidase family serine peptidase [Ornithinimicrobium laminariae]